MGWTALISGTTRPFLRAWQTACATAVHAGSPGKQQKRVAGKRPCSPRGAAELLPGLMEMIPEGGCLSVGTRVRRESRVVGLAGFGPGTPVGPQGSLGPHGEPGKTAFFPPVHLEDFTLVPRKSRQALARGNPYRPPPWLGGQSGSRFWPSLECAPRRADKAPGGRAESRAKRKIMCYSAGHAWTLFSLGLRNSSTPPAQRAWFEHVGFAYQLHPPSGALRACRPAILGGNCEDMPQIL